MNCNSAHRKRNSMENELLYKIELGNVITIFFIIASFYGQANLY